MRRFHGGNCHHGDTTVYILYGIVSSCILTAASNIAESRSDHDSLTCNSRKATDKNHNVKLQSKRKN